MSSQLQSDLFLSNTSYELYNYSKIIASNAFINNLVEESNKASIGIDNQSSNTINLTSSSYFETFTTYYLQVHGYLSLIVCIFGIIANLVNILVLTRKEMRSPTNYILTGLAIADLLVMVDYVPFNIHNNIQNLTEQERLTWIWSIIALLHMHVSIVFHTVSCWLTILLAVWRYLAVSFPTQTKAWLTQQKSLICIIAVYIIVPICCIPLYLSFNIFEEIDVKQNNTTTYRVEWSELARNNSFLMHLNIWVFSVGTKLVPCVLLTYLSFSLIHVLIEADKRKRRLQGLNQRKEPLLNKALINDKKPTSHSKENDLIEVKTSPNSNNECLNILVPKKNANSNPVSNMSESNSNLSLSLKKKPNQESDLNNNKDQKNTKIKLVNNSDNKNISPKRNSDQKRHSTGCISNQSIVMIQSKKETLLNSKKSKNIFLKSPTVDCNKNTSNVNLTASNNTNSQHSSQSDRTTKMLISVLLIFLMTEFPSGILVLLSSILGEKFFNEVYQPLGSLLDLLALINSAVNFVLYCSMSKQFRSTFSKLVLRRNPKNEFSNVSKLKPKNHKKTNYFK